MKKSFIPSRSRLMILFALTVLTASFQNCGNTSGTFEDVGAEQAAVLQADFFNYPYTAPPTYYGEATASVVSDLTASGGLLTLQIVATVRDVADLTASTPFILQIQASDGTLLCPELTGIATPTTTTFTENCVTPREAAHLTLILTMGTGASAQVATKSL